MNFQKASVLLSILSLAVTASSYEILKISRDMQNEGFHKDLITKIIGLGSQEHLQCSLVFREDISTDIYIKVEELQALQNLEFWPVEAQDIEKRQQFAKNYEFIWRLPLDASNTDKYGSWVKEYSQESSQNGTIITQVIQYPFHFRYQPPSDIQVATKVPYPGPPQAFLDSINFDESFKAHINMITSIKLTHSNFEYFLILLATVSISQMYQQIWDCQQTPLGDFSKSSKAHLELNNLVTFKNQPETIYGLIPNVIDKQGDHSFYFYSSCVLGLLILQIYRRSKYYGYANIQSSQFLINAGIFTCFQTLASQNILIAQSSNLILVFVGRIQLKIHLSQ